MVHVYLEVAVHRDVPLTRSFYLRVLTLAPCTDRSFWHVHSLLSTNPQTQSVFLQKENTETQLKKKNKCKQKQTTRYPWTPMEIMAVLPKHPVYDINIATNFLL